MTDLPRPLGLLFDMDGTLTEPLLDFPAIRRDLGLEPGAPILEALAAMTDAERGEANAKLDLHEKRAAEASQLADGCHDLLDHVAAIGLPYAVVTRNSRHALELVWDKHRLPACETVTRDDAQHKPDPEPLRLAASRLGLSAEACWMIGDGQYDVEAARAAGCASVWISHGKDPRPFDATPDVTIAGLREVLSLLR